MYPAGAWLALSEGTGEGASGAGNAEGSAGPEDAEASVSSPVSGAFAAAAGCALGLARSDSKGASKAEGCSASTFSDPDAAGMSPWPGCDGLGEGWGDGSGTLDGAAAATD